MKEAILVKEAMQDTGIYLLLLDDLRLLEALQSDNQLLDSFVNLMRFCTENVLEVLIGSLVDLFSALSWTYLPWEEHCVLSNQVFNLVLDILRDFDEYVLCLRWIVWMKLKLGWILDERLEIGWIFKVLHSHTETLLAKMRSLENLISDSFNRLLVFLCQLL